MNTTCEGGSSKVKSKALKALVNAMKQESRIYFLEYKGKKLHYIINEHNADYSNNPKETRISSTYLKNLILSKTIDVADQDLKNIEIENNTTNDIDNNTNTNGGD